MKIKEVFLKYKYVLVFIMILVVAEAIMMLLFPLFIGIAVDDAIVEKNSGIIYLFLLGLSALIVGSLRRLFDSSVYTKIYINIGELSVAILPADQASKKVARLTMTKELVEFLENAFPEMVNAFLRLSGGIIIIISMNIKIGLTCLLVTGLIFSLNFIKRNQIISLNKMHIKEIEKQVEIVSKNDENELDKHLRNIMKSNTKLSNHEAVSFAFNWILLIGFLVLSILIAIDDGITNAGALLSITMYVFHYTENVRSMPAYYQSWLRLTEIKQRIESV